MFVCNFYALPSEINAVTFPVLIRLYTRLPPGSRRTKIYVQTATFCNGFVSVPKHIFIAHNMELQLQQQKVRVILSIKVQGLTYASKHFKAIADNNKIRGQPSFSEAKV